jgi:hypothetical protein
MCRGPSCDSVPAFASTEWAKLSETSDPSVRAGENSPWLNRAASVIGNIPSKVKVKLSLCLTNEALLHEGLQGSGYIGPHFLDLGTSCIRMASFTPLPLYPWWKIPRYPLDRRLGWSQSQSGWLGEEKELAPTGTRTPNPRLSSP